MTAIDQLLAQRLLPLPPDWPATELRCAAVLCLLVQHKVADQVLLIARAAGQGPHAGQLGFPGGMRQADETPAATALRETHEELGIPAPAVQIHGSLPPRASSSGVLVHCLVGRLPPVRLQPAQREVERVLWLPLPQALTATSWPELPPPAAASGHQLPTSPQLRLASGELLWGLTARFLRDLAALLQPDS